MKRLFAWLEGEVSRGRKLMLLSVVFSFVFLDILILLAFVFGFGGRLEGYFPYFSSLGALAATAVGFYTATSPKSKEGDKK